MKHLGVFDSYNVRRHMRHEPEPPVSFTKSVIAGVVMGVFCLGVLAFCTGHARSTELDTKLMAMCSGVGQLSENVMTGRQRGVPLDKMLTIMDTFPATPAGESARKVTTAIIAEAYNGPQFEFEASQEAAIKRFRERVQSACMLGVI